jgi:hypothetical protein
VEECHGDCGSPYESTCVESAISEKKTNKLTVSEAKGALQTRPHFFLSHPPWAPIYGGGDYGMA